MSRDTHHIAIIGAGLAGCSLALELEKRGLNPILVHNPDGIASSDVAAGLINPIVPKGVRLTWNWEHMFPHWLAHYQQWEQTLNASFVEELPLYQLHQHADHFSEWEKKLNQAAYKPFLSGCTKALPEGAKVQSGHWVKQAGRLNVQTFCRATRAHFQEQHRLLLLSWTPGSSRAPFELSPGIVAEKLVYCQGIELMDNPIWNWLPMHPTGGDILRVSLPEGLLSQEAIWKSREWLVPVSDRPGEWLMGSNFHKGDRSTLPALVDANDLLDKVENWLGVRPQLLEHKRAVRPTVGSRRPYLGQHPLHAELFVFNGLGSKGSALCSWLAPLMADFLIGKAELPEEVDARRFWESSSSDQRV